MPKPERPNMCVKNKSDFLTIHIIVSMKEQFGAWMSDYGRRYASEKEYDDRLAIFSQNAKMVFEHNAGKHSYTSKPQFYVPRKKIAYGSLLFVISSEVKQVC